MKICRGMFPYPVATKPQRQAEGTILAIGYVPLSAGCRTFLGEGFRSLVASSFNYANWRYTGKISYRQSAVDGISGKFYFFTFFIYLFFCLMKTKHITNVYADSQHNWIPVLVTSRDAPHYYVIFLIGLITCLACPSVHLSVLFVLLSRKRQCVEKPILLRTFPVMSALSISQLDGGLL